MSLTSMLGNPGGQYDINNHIYTADGSTGLITSYVDQTTGSTVSGVALTDIQGLLAAGCTFGVRRSKTYNCYGIAPAAASAALCITQQALSNGALAIDASPSIPRQVAVIIDPGTVAITAGTLSLPYTDENGASQTDVFSLVTAVSTLKTMTTTHGVTTLSAGTVAGLVGGHSPTVKAGTNTVLALPTDGNYQDLTIHHTIMDGAAATNPTQSSTGSPLITPNTAPNGTHTYTFGYSFTSP